MRPPTREEQRRAEMNRGANIVRRDMAQGLIDRLGNELDQKSSFTLIWADPNPRNWEVLVAIRDTGVTHQESFWVFPSDELRAKILLVTGGK